MHHNVDIVSFAYRDVPPYLRIGVFIPFYIKVYERNVCLSIQLVTKREFLQNCYILGKNLRATAQAQYLGFDFAAFFACAAYLF